MAEGDLQGQFSCLDEVPCHLQWEPFRSESEASIERLISSLQCRLESEPGLQSLHRLSLAYLHLLRSDENECRRYLDEAKQPNPDRLALDLAFLIKAMELNVMHKFDPNEEEEQRLLQQLSGLWQNPQVQASVWGAKGWTLISFGWKRLDEAMKAFREAMKLEAEKNLVPRFHWRYGLAVAMAKQRRKADLSGEIGEERVELWDEAKQILDNAGVPHPEFLAQFAEAIAYSAVHFKKCKDLAEQAVRIADGLVENFKVYTIIPKVYRGLCKVVQWGNIPVHGDGDDTLQELRNKELDVLQAGEMLFPLSSNEFLKSDFAFQYALYFIKTQEAGEDRIQKAREWLAKVNRDNIWAKLRLLALDEDEESVDRAAIRQRYEQLINEAEGIVSRKARFQVRFELGRFLLVSGEDPSLGIIQMKMAAENLPNLYFLSWTKRRQILDADKPGVSVEDTNWIRENIRSQFDKTARFPKAMVEQGYRWRLGCEDCCQTEDLIRYTVKKGSAGLHDCKETLLLLKINRQDPNWLRIRKKNKTDRCFESGTEHRIERCRSAHSTEEATLFMQEESGLFNQENFLKQVRRRRSQPAS